MSKLEEWMQKLMWYVEEMRGEWINVCRPQFQQFDLLEMVLISKHYPLIKWLVEGDKIDIVKRIKYDLKNGWDMENYKYDKNKSKKNRVRYWTEYLLMTLSIQDEPIKFLISILK